MRILVTGATGFIGLPTMRVLVNRGQEVGALVLPDDPRRSALPAEVAQFAGALATPPTAALAAWRPEVCIHCAWVAAAGVYMESPLNRDFLGWSRDFIRSLSTIGLRRFVGVGSCAERLGDQGSEEVPPPYVKCKRDLCRFLFESLLGAEGVWARIHYVYGIGEDPNRFISSMIESFRKGRRFTVRCPDVRKDYIHVSDVASALASLATGETDGRVDVGTGIGVPLGAIADRVAGLMESGHLLAKGGERDLGGDVVASPVALHRLGWFPRVALSEGIEEMVRQVHGRLE